MEGHLGVSEGGSCAIWLSKRDNGLHGSAVALVDKFLVYE
jgi:hypothetical protein